MVAGVAAAGAAAPAGPAAGEAASACGATAPARMTAASAAVARTRLNCIECGPQVGNEITGIFDAHRDADQRIGDADPIPRLFGDAGVRGARRVRHEGFGAAEAHGELDHLQRIEHAECLRLAALDRESE